MNPIPIWISQTKSRPLPFEVILKINPVGKFQRVMALFPFFKENEKNRWFQLEIFLFLLLMESLDPDPFLPDLKKKEKVL